MNNTLDLAGLCCCLHLCFHAKIGAAGEVGDWPDGGTVMLPLFMPPCEKLGSRRSRRPARQWDRAVAFIYASMQQLGLQEKSATGQTVGLLYCPHLCFHATTGAAGEVGDWPDGGTTMLPLFMPPCENLGSRRSRRLARRWNRAVAFVYASMRQQGQQEKSATSQTVGLLCCLYLCLHARTLAAGDVGDWPDSAIMFVF